MSAVPQISSGGEWTDGGPGSWPFTYIRALPSIYIRRRQHAVCGFAGCAARSHGGRRRPSTDNSLRSKGPGGAPSCHCRVMRPQGRAQKPTTAARALHVPRGRTKKYTGTADQADERTGSSDARIGGFGDGTLDGSDGWKQLGWSWGMTASIPGENDTKRHRIALAALPFFLSACHLMPASKSGGVPSERAPVVWTVGHRASSSCTCRAAHTREMHGSSESTKNCNTWLRWFIRPIREKAIAPFAPRWNRNQLAERSRLTSRTTYLRTCEVVL